MDVERESCIAEADCIDTACCYVLSPLMSVHDIRVCLLVVFRQSASRDNPQVDS